MSNIEDLFLLNTEKVPTVIKHVLFKAVSTTDIWHRFVFGRNESENVGSLIQKDELDNLIYNGLEQLNESFYNLNEYTNSLKNKTNS